MHIHNTGCWLYWEHKWVARGIEHEFYYGTLFAHIQLLTSLDRGNAIKGAGVGVGT